MYVDPPAPKPRGRFEEPPINTTGPLDDPQRAWRFNPDYERLVVAWQTVKPQLDELRTVLDKVYQLATNRQTWDAPVGERYVEDIREWRNRLALYRHAVLTEISDEASDTPRWLPTTANAPHAYPS